MDCQTHRSVFFSGEKLTSKALEIFAECAESMSFADAYCPNLSNTQSNSARFGLWGAHLKRGLTDEHVTVEESSDWLACETRSSIRGALEVANLDDCFVKVKSLSEDRTETGNSPVEEITGDQPPQAKVCYVTWKDYHQIFLHVISILQCVWMQSLRHKRGKMLAQKSLRQWCKIRNNL